MHFSTDQWVLLVVGVLVPILTGLLVRWDAAPSVKRTANLLLAVGAGALVTWLQGGDAAFSAYVSAGAITWVASVASYFGLLKDPADDVSAATANFGVG